MANYNNHQIQEKMGIYFRKEAISSKNLITNADN